MNINTYVNVQDDTGREGYSYNTESHDDELYVVVSSGNGASYMLPNYIWINVNLYPTVTTNLARTAAHEFGHILGLCDYYSNDGNEVPVINDSVQKNSEIRMHGLMNSAILEKLDTVPNDIEMTLYGAIDNTFSCSQRFIPINSEIKIYNSFKYAANENYAVIIDAADGFENVETLEIPSAIDGVEVVKISNYAFENQSSLKSIVLPNGIIDIGYSAFENCHNLAEVNFPEQLQYIRQNAFKSCALKEIIIFSDVEKIFDSTFEDCNFLKSITVDNNKFYYSEDGVLFNKEKTKLIQYPVGNNRGEYIIPNGVETISGNAFKGCTSLKNVSIPEGVEYIGWAAFESTALETIYIPSSVKIIQNYAFYSCNSLRSVTFKKELPENYANNIFWASDSNLKIYVPNESIALYEQWITTSTVSFYPITEE